MGLFLGVSILSFIEIVDLILNILYLRMEMKNKVANANNYQDHDDKLFISGQKRSTTSISFHDNHTPVENLKETSNHHLHDSSIWFRLEKKICGELLVKCSAFQRVNLLESLSSCLFKIQKKEFSYH